MLYSYSFQNRKRDLSDILSTVVKDEPRFISNFKTVADATARKHEWLEDQISGRSVTVTDYASGIVSVSAADAAKLKKGTLLVPRNDSVLFQIVSVNGTDVTVAKVADNGSATVAPAAGMVLNLVSTPVAEGSVSGEGDETGITADVQYNTTQIFRKDIILTGSALAVNVFGNVDNQLNRQTAFALGELARDLNRVALFGRRVEVSANTKGEAGGLYFFGTGEGALEIDAAKTGIDSTVINDAAQAVMGAGGTLITTSF